MLSNGLLLNQYIATWKWYLKNNIQKLEYVCVRFQSGLVHPITLTATRPPPSILISIGSHLIICPVNSFIKWTFVTPSLRKQHIQRFFGCVGFWMCSWPAIKRTGGGGGGGGDCYFYPKAVAENTDHSWTGPQRTGSARKRWTPAVIH